MSTSNFFGRQQISYVVAFLLASVFFFQTAPVFGARPITLIARKSGDWNQPSTWHGGGLIPRIDDAVIIPAGITVTIPSGYSAANHSNSLGIEVSGTLVVSGKLNANMRFKIHGGGTFTINSTGKVTFSLLMENYGLFTNKGGLTSNAPYAYNYKDFINEQGAVLDNRGAFTMQGDSFTNRGTINNYAQLDFYTPTDNYGTITNPSGKQMGIYREFRNRAGAKLTNLGIFLIHGACGILNDGAIQNNSAKLTNDGFIQNSCTGTFTGTAPVGKAPVKKCP